MLIIIAIALVGYPLLGFLLVWLTRNHPALRKVIIGVLASISILTLIAYLTDVSTVSNSIDGIIVSLTYLLILVLLWKYALNVSGTKRLNRVLSLIISILFVDVFIFFYMVFGMKVEHKRVIPVEGVIVKEYILGHATVDYRGLRVVVFKKSNILPFIERVLSSKTYDGLIFYNSIYQYNKDRDAILVKLYRVDYSYIDTTRITDTTIIQDTISLN